MLLACPGCPLCASHRAQHPAKQQQRWEGKRSQPETWPISFEQCSWQTASGPCTFRISCGAVVWAVLATGARDRAAVGTGLGHFCPLLGSQGQHVPQGPRGVGQVWLRPMLQTGCSGFLLSKLSHSFPPDEVSVLLLHPLPRGPQRSCLFHLPHLILQATCHATPPPRLPRSCLSSSFYFGAWRGLWSSLVQGIQLTPPPVQRLQSSHRGVANPRASSQVPEISHLGNSVPHCHDLYNGTKRVAAPPTPDNGKDLNELRRRMCLQQCLASS